LLTLRVTLAELIPASFGLKMQRNFDHFPFANVTLLSYNCKNPTDLRRLLAVMGTTLIDFLRSVEAMSAMNDHKRLNLRGCIAASVTVNLSTSDSRVCALIGGDLIEGVAGYGSSIHEALHDLADKIAEKDILSD
jgi:hypothetical protein